jgi:ABC-2 type transport system ATP-binding protein
MNAITVDHLVHTYPAQGRKSPARTAVRDISFAVPAGRMAALLGPNGSGKSTTFQILSTIFAPTSGLLKIMDADVVRHPEAARRALGVVFQNPSVDKKLTVEENLICQGHLYGLRGADLRGRIERGLARLRLTDRRHDFVETLSGGLRRRVELAKCLLHEPRVLLLDEPTTGLDPGARRDLWDTLTEMRQQTGLTILVTTHLMEEAERCDQVVILHEGRIVAEGTPDALKSEIGGDVIDIETASPDRLRDQINAAFHAAASVMDGNVRMEIQGGAEWIPKLVQAFPADISAVRLSKPSLEDVFIKKTGFTFASHE